MNVKGGGRTRTVGLALATGRTSARIPTYAVFPATVMRLPVPLPVYPKEVTDGTALTVNQPGERSAENYVRTLLQLPTDDPRYVRDQYGTKCNFFVHDCLHLLGYQYTSMVANVMVHLADQGQLAPFHGMSLPEAIVNVSQGCPTWAGLEEPDAHGHVVMVLPSAPALHAGELMVAQAGARNFFGRALSFSWPRRDLDRVKFYGAP